MGSNRLTQENKETFAQCFGGKQAATDAQLWRENTVAYNPSHSFADF